MAVSTDCPKAPGANRNRRPSGPGRGTQVSGSWAIVTCTPVSCSIRSPMPRRSAPPPHSVMPCRRTSPASSGGVTSITSWTASMMARSDFASAMRACVFFMPKSRAAGRSPYRGRGPQPQAARRAVWRIPPLSSRIPRSAHRSRAGTRRAEPDNVVIETVAGDLQVRETTVPPMEITAISVVPPPISTISCATGTMIGSPAPSAAATGDSTRYTFAHPAFSAASSTDFRSTSVRSSGIAMIARRIGNE